MVRGRTRDCAIPWDGHHERAGLGGHSSRPRASKLEALTKSNAMRLSTPSFVGALQSTVADPDRAVEGEDLRCPLQQRVHHLVDLGEGLVLVQADAALEGLHGCRLVVCQVEPVQLQVHVLGLAQAVAAAQGQKAVAEHLGVEGPWHVAPGLTALDAPAHSTSPAANHLTT